MPFDNLMFEVSDTVATITLDRPDSLNAMSVGLIDDLHRAVETIDDEPSVRVLVITGAGRGFCSGADLGGSGPVGETSTGRVDPAELMETRFNPAMRALHSCPVPTVARVNGVAAGGGFGLALACDIAVAARSAGFVATFGPRLGIVPDLGTTWNLPRKVGRARAMAAAMLGERITADEAEEWGLIYRAVDDEALDDEVARVCGILARSSAEAMVRIRDAIDRGTEHSFSDHLDVELGHQQVLLPLNMVEGAVAFMEKRDPDFRGRA